MNQQVRNVLNFLKSSEDNTDSTISVVVPISCSDIEENSITELVNTLASFNNDELVISRVILSVSDTGVSSEHSEILERIVRNSNIVSIIRGKVGRGSQLSVAVRLVSSKYIWFLHLDSELSLGAKSALLKATSGDDGSSIYYFKLRFSSDSKPLCLLNSFFANIRSSLLSLPFGDQGLFMSKSAYLKVGGFNPNFSRGEDYLFILKAKRSGLNISPLQSYIITSGRRYSKLGWFTATYRNVRETILFPIINLKLWWKG